MNTGYLVVQIIWNFGWEEFWLMPYIYGRLIIYCSFLCLLITVPTVLIGYCWNFVVLLSVLSSCASGWRVLGLLNVSVVVGCFVFSILIGCIIMITRSNFVTFCSNFLTDYILMNAWLHPITLNFVEELGHQVKLLDTCLFSFDQYMELFMKCWICEVVIFADVVGDWWHCIRRAQRGSYADTDAPYRRWR